MGSTMLVQCVLLLTLAVSVGGQNQQKKPPPGCEERMTICANMDNPKACELWMCPLFNWDTVHEECRKDSIEKCTAEDQLDALHRDRQCNECPTGNYRSCSKGSYYAYDPKMCIYASKEVYNHDEARKLCQDRDTSGFLAFAENEEELRHIACTFPQRKN